MRALLLAALLAAALLAPAAHADPAPSLGLLKPAALAKALDYLEGLALAGPGDAYLVEAVQGAGLDPGLWPTPAHNVLDTLDIPSVGPASTAPPHPDPTRALHAYLQSGYNPHDVGGRDLVADLKAQWPQSLQTVGFATFTILGLHAAGLPDSDPVIQDAVLSLQGGQTSAGAWICGLGPSVDCTGFALTALDAVHALLPSTAALSGSWLDQVRHADGGYQENPDPLHPARSNTQSTIWAINGYRAIGAPEPEACWRFLLSMQRPDGSFLLSANQTDATGWPTKEVVASFTRPFNVWPVYHAATALVPALHADVPARLSIAEPAFTAAAWRALGPGEATGQGTTTSLTLGQPGAWTVAVEAQGAGTHHRERIPATVLNDPPAFSALPAFLPADRVAQLTFTPQATDPEGQPVAVAWSLDGVPGQGAVAATFTALGSHTLHLTATDPHGATAEADVPVVVGNLPPRLVGLDLPASVTAGATFTFAATAADPDGPAPTLHWRVGDLEADGVAGQASLPAGLHTVELVLTDSEGAVTTVVRTLEAQAQPVAASTAAAPTEASAAASAPVSPVASQGGAKPVSIVETHAASAPAAPASQGSSLAIQVPEPAHAAPAAKPVKAVLATPAPSIMAQLGLALGLVAALRARRTTL
jgi:hypothetical protein